MKCCKVGDLKKCLKNLPDGMDIRVDFSGSSDWLRITEVRAEHELFNQDDETTSYLELIAEAVEDDSDEQPEDEGGKIDHPTLFDLIEEKEIDLDKK